MAQFVNSTRANDADSTERYPLFQMILPDGDTLVDERDIDTSLLIKMYTKMLRARLFDQKAITMQRQGRIGTYAPFEGQEAAQIGSAMALSDGDWLFPTYRDHAATMTYGHDLLTIFLYWKGRIEGCVPPEGMNILPPSVPIATQLLHAVGTGWAEQRKGTDRVSIAYFGDGATSEGDFHEGLNFASVYNTPTIFLCQNNHYAISVPQHKQMKSKTIAQKVDAYDIEGIRVDGNDVYAVYTTVSKAIDKARNGGGPTLIEAVTWRYGAHTTADDPTKYRDQQESEARRTEDCLSRVHTYLSLKGAIGDDWLKREQAIIQSEIDEAAEAVDRFPDPDATVMFEHVYQTKSASLIKQHERYEKEAHQ
ncbi:branched-chain alpha-keto acid dehydrogenase, E1 component, alpha subunit [Geomicrobium sp. JCM 19039]|nr:pyruvate dehydrogenase (acetyl-transferring) E1 component subunit alpha [Geomicrobium sp. JCM 19039]GAK12564.1 branched-chain alpha-keto acid dehydrogenase, E1 component, alpha subunit [Geomicrobium sp. JCM 19039]